MIYFITNNHNYRSIKILYQTNQIILYQLKKIYFRSFSKSIDQSTRIKWYEVSVLMNENWMQFSAFQLFSIKTEHTKSVTQHKITFLRSEYVFLRCFFIIWCNSFIAMWLKKQKTETFQTCHVANVPRWCALANFTLFDSSRCNSFVRIENVYYTVSENSQK